MGRGSWQRGVLRKGSHKEDEPEETSLTCVTSPRRKLLSGHRRPQPTPFVVPDEHAVRGGRRDDPTLGTGVMRCNGHCCSAWSAREGRKVFFSFIFLVGVEP